MAHLAAEVTLNGLASFWLELLVWFLKVAFALPFSLKLINIHRLWTIVGCGRFVGVFGGEWRVTCSSMPSSINCSICTFCCKFSFSKGLRVLQHDLGVNCIFQALNIIEQLLPGIWSITTKLQDDCSKCSCIILH